jgi:hypothetical protein
MRSLLQFKSGVLLLSLLFHEFIQLSIHFSKVELHRQNQDEKKQDKD